MKTFHSPLTSTRLQRPLAAVMTVFLLAAACRLSSASPAAPTPSLNSVATIVAGTLAALTPPASATLPPTAIPPTFAPPAAIRISFAAGATYSVTTGTIQPGQSQNFVLKALQGQPMIVMVDSYNHDVTLAIKTQAGGTLLEASQKRTMWQSLLPATQDYTITVIGGASGEDFTLSVEIPSRITFAAGTDSASVSGQTVNGYDVAYVLYANAGQKMTVKLSGTSGNVALSIYGYNDGQPYLRSHLGATEWAHDLPATQDYIIHVVPQGGQVVNYTLNVTVK